MNIAIRILQAFLALAVLNNVFALAVIYGFSSLYKEGKPTFRYTLVSIVTTVVLCLSIFQLQRYYEIRNKQPTNMSGKKFLGVAFTSASIVAFIGLSVVIIIIMLALINIS